MNSKIIKFLGGLSLSIPFTHQSRALGFSSLKFNILFILHSSHHILITISILINNYCTVMFAKWILYVIFQNKITYYLLLGTERLLRVSTNKNKCHWKLWSKHYVSYGQIDLINWCNLSLARRAPPSSVNTKEQVPHKVMFKQHVSYSQFGSIKLCNLSLVRGAPPSSVNKQKQVALKVMIKTLSVLLSIWLNQLM